MHVEDWGLPGFNIHIAGPGKLWLIIPREFYHRVEGLVRDELSDMNLLYNNFENHSDLLSSKMVFILPEVLKKKKIPHWLVKVEAGQIIFLNWNVIHGGITLSNKDSGLNLNYAANFCTNEWIEAVKNGDIKIGPSSKRGHFDKNSKNFKDCEKAQKKVQPPWK